MNGCSIVVIIGVIGTLAAIGAIVGTIKQDDTKADIDFRIVTQNTTLNLFAGPSTNTHLDNITKYDVIPYRIWACA